MLRRIASENRGALYGLLSALLFGASTPAAKVLLGSASPQLVAGLLYLGSGIGLAIVRGLGVVSRKSAQEAPLRGRDWLWLAAATLSGGLLAPVLLINGLARTTAANASMLLNLEGVATALIAWSFFREHTSRRMIAGMGVILLGATLLSWSGRPSFGTAVGPLMIAIACLCWAIDNNATRNIAGGDPFTIVTIKSVFAGSVNTAIAVLVLHDRMPDGPVISMIALVGFLGYGVSLLCFVLALRHTGTARTSAYFSTAPFVGTILAVVFLHAGFDWKLVAAGVLMALGTYLHLTEEHGHEHIHEGLEHEHSHVHDAHHRHAHAASDPPGEPHAHRHFHQPLVHTHMHFPDEHHRHAH
ncbi:MAG: DMT family transporter [Candidatus Tyrphobacter sp.]